MVKITKRLLTFLLVCTVIISSQSNIFMHLSAASIPQAKDVDSRLVFNQEYPSVGTPLTVSVQNDTSGNSYTYIWTVGGETVTNNTTNSYTPSVNDLEKFITVKATSNTGDAVYEETLYFSTLPVVYIDTENNAPVTSKEDYMNANLHVQGNSEYNSKTTALYSGLTEIRGRGNHSWGLPKKPYKLKLDKKTSVFGMSRSKHFVMLADYTDKSLMRNLTSFAFADSQTKDSVTKMTSVILVFNGSYEGVYQFGENIRMGEGRVDIYDWENTAADISSIIGKAEKLSSSDISAFEDALVTNLSWITTKNASFKGNSYDFSEYDIIFPDITNPENTGGFIAEIDMYYDEISKFYSGMDKPIQFKSPEYLNTNSDLFQNVQTFINAFEASVKSGDYHTTYNGTSVHYSDLFDIESLLEYLFVNELTMNADGMLNSNYFHKDIGKPARFGPPWDFEWAFGQSWYSDEMPYNNWFVKQFNNNSHQTNNYYHYLTRDPYFLVRIYEHYKKIRSAVLEDLIKTDGYLDQLIDKLSKPGVANYIKWYGADSADSKYGQETSKVKTYIKNRIAWLDDQCTSLETMINSYGTYSPSSKLAITAIDTNGTEGYVAVTASITEPAMKTAAFHVNGKLAGYAPVDDETATFLIPDSLLEREKDVLNVVVVRGRNESGDYNLNDGSTVRSNFAVFHKNLLIPVDEITVSPIFKTIKEGSEFNLTPVIKPVNATDYTICYTSDDPSIASVSNDGTVKGVSAGNTVIRISAGQKEASCNVTVIAKETEPSESTEDTEPSGNGNDIINIPDQVTSFKTVSRTSRSILLKWNKVKDAAGYTIYKGNDPIYNVTNNKTQCKITQLKGGKKLKSGGSYRFTIAAYRLDKGKRVYGKTAVLATCTRPSKPVLSKMPASVSKVKLQWKKAKDAKNYQVLMSKNKTKGYKQLKKTTRLSYVVPSGKVKKGKTYYFKIRSYKKINGKTVYSSDSSIRAIRIK